MVHSTPSRSFHHHVCYTAEPTNVRYSRPYSAAFVEGPIYKMSYDNLTIILR